MKGYLLVAAAACAAVLALGGNLAWAGGPVAAFDIPFPFEVQGRTMPPGHYVVTPMGSGLGKLALLNKCCGKLMMATVAGRLDSTSGDKVSAVFHGTNGKYVLSEIHRPGPMHGQHELPVSLAGGQTTIAEQGQKHEVVIVAGR